MNTQHVSFADSDLFKGTCIITEQLVVVDETLIGRRNGRFAFDDGFEQLDGHVPADFEGDDVGVGLIRPDDADGDTPSQA